MSGWDLEALAASLRRDSDDVALYAGFLINTVSASLPPEMVRIDRKAGVFGRVREDAPVLGVAVLIGDRRFTLDRRAVGRPVNARICLESGGVVLGTESVGMDVWSRELAAALTRHAETNAGTARLLRQLTSPELS